MTNDTKDSYYACEEKECDQFINIDKDTCGKDYLIVIAHTEGTEKAMTDIISYTPDEMKELFKQERVYLFCNKCYPFLVLEFDLHKEGIGKYELDQIVKVPHDHDN